MKKILALVLCLGLIIQVAILPASAQEDVPFAVYTIEESEPSEYGYVGYKFVDANGNELELTTVEDERGLNEELFEAPLYYYAFIPSSFDLRDYGYVTPVKYQGSTGNCWAFACLSSLESNSVMRGNSEYSDTDFSEPHIVWFSKNSKATDENDMNYGEGVTDENPYTGSASGGNDGDVTVALARWSGLAKESDYPFYPFKSDAYSTIGNYGENTRYDKGSGVVIKSSEKLTDATAVKQWIMENGAVTAAYYNDSNLYNKTTYAYNYTSEKICSHMIAIVGWDDNYSVDNFLPEWLRKTMVHGFVKIVGALLGGLMVISGYRMKI